MKVGLCGQLGSYARADSRVVHGLEKGLALQSYCEICREYLAKANTRAEELQRPQGVQEACSRLEQRLEAVTAAVRDERFRAEDEAMVEELCQRVHDFIRTFRASGTLQQSDLFKQIQ
mmetsp:Transcript_12242/g.25167  ORF Transcript_12242/g.25167 Transcript_12242/m.25167 type:complete len:118 (-) Transcript_12242:8-361(-)